MHWTHEKNANLDTQNNSIFRTVKNVHVINMFIKVILKIFIERN